MALIQLARSSVDKVRHSLRTAGLVQFACAKQNKPKRKTALRASILHDNGGVNYPMTYPFIFENCAVFICRGRASDDRGL